MPITKNIFRYYFKLGNKIVCAGVTHDPYQRAITHLNQPGWNKGHMVEVGLPVEYDDAVEWLREQKKKGRHIIEEHLLQSAS